MALEVPECVNDNDCVDGFECVEGGVCLELPPERFENADCPDDGEFCNGEETCTAGVCGFAGNPCGGETPVCDEAADVCVECLINGDCFKGSECVEGACVPVGH